MSCHIERAAWPIGGTNLSPLWPAHYRLRFRGGQYAHKRGAPAVIGWHRRCIATSMKVFIVHAHHEPASFNGSLTREAVAALRNAGHELRVSDLYEMDFDPVSDRRNFTSIKDPSRLKQQVEEEHASVVNGYAPELQAEM